MQFEEFAPLIEWWDARVENEHAWKVRVDDVLKYDENKNLLSVNLDIKNPNRKDDLEHLPPHELAESILVKEKQIAELMDEIKSLLAKGEHNGKRLAMENLVRCTERIEMCKLKLIRFIETWVFSGMHTGFSFVKKSQVMKFKPKNYIELN